MAEKRKFQAIKGTRDLLPPETELWNRVEQTAREVFGSFGFGEIRPPIFEPTELFARAVGGETDIVSKEMYPVEDRPVDLPDFQAASENLPEYARDLIKAYKAGEIPQSPMNHFRIQKLERKLEQLQAADERLQSGARARRDVRGDVKEHSNTLVEIFSLTRDMELSIPISLRPEATARVCRAYIEHGMQRWRSR